MNTKSKIYVLVLIWAAALLQLFINSSINREEKMVEQVMSYGIDNLQESTVKAYAYYGNELLTPDKKEAIVRHLATEISLDSGYEITSKDTESGSITTLEKKGAQADTTIKVISLTGEENYGQNVQENYIMMEIILKGSAGSTAYTYKDTLDTLYKDLGMAPTTNIYMCSQTKGQLTDSETETMINNFMESVDANEIERLTLDDTLCVYGYSKNIDEYVYQNDKKVNVNIAFTYNATEDVTYIHRGIPFIDKSF
ncbi:MAG: hypothetical protein E7259_07140 [Lachnospiraceae bacterium]|nr:hypothetical protein [Lachnospiraceae bacterium]